MSHTPNRACPECQKNGHDKTGDHLYLMADGKTWCCQRAHHHDNQQIYLEDDDGTQKELAEKPEISGETYSLKDVHGKETGEFVEPSTFPVVGWRGIPEYVYGNAGVHAEVNEDGDPVAFYYPLFTQEGEMLWKIRKLPKTFFTSETVGDRKLLFFNQDKVGLPKRLLITEGQDDALAAAFMLAKWNVAVVSVPNGANIKAFVDNYEWLQRIEDITFDPDCDEAGEKLRAKVVELLPHIKILKKTKKDACDMLKAKLKDEYVDDYFRAKPYKPECIKEISDELIEEATTPVEYGLDYPFPSLTEKTFGFITPCVIGIAGAPGSGKTTFVQAIQSHFVYKHGMPIGIIDLENRPGFALRKLIGYQLGVKIHTPDTPYPPELQERAREIGRELKERGVVFYDNQGDLEWDNVMAAMRYMVVVKGIKAIFIDPISGLVAHLSASEGNEYLNKAMFQASQLTRELDFGLFHINHLNNPHTDKDHSEGAVVRGSQFAGSRAMWKYSTDLWGIEGNQQAENEEERLRILLRIIKHRLDGRTGTLPYRYNKETGRHEELKANDLFRTPGTTSRIPGPSGAGGSNDITDGGNVQAEEKPPGNLSDDDKRKGADQADPGGSRGSDGDATVNPEGRGADGQCDSPTGRNSGEASSGTSVSSRNLRTGSSVPPGPKGTMGRRRPAVNTAGDSEAEARARSAVGRRTGGTEGSKYL